MEIDINTSQAIQVRNFFHRFIHTGLGFGDFIVSTGYTATRWLELFRRSLQ